MKLNAENLFAKGLIFYKEERYCREALRIFNAVLQLDPKNYDALYFRSRCYGNLCNDRQAHADLIKAKALDPNDADFYFKRGMSLENYQGNGIQRLISFSRAIAYEPNFAEAYFQRGKTFWRLHYSEYDVIDSAYSDVEQALELKPDCSEFYDTYVGLCYDSGKYKKGIEFFNKLIERDPKNIAAYDARTKLYEYFLSNGSVTDPAFQKIFDDYKKIIETSDFETSYARGEAYYRLEQYERAIEDCTKLIELNPSNADAYELREKCFKALGDTKRAREDFFKYKELHCERETDPYYKLVRYGELYQERGDYEQAIEKFSAAITLKPEMPQTYKKRGQCFDALGNMKRAREDFSQAEKIRTAPRKKTDWELRREKRDKLYSEYLKLARDADKNQDYAAAVEYYTNALENSNFDLEDKAYIERCEVYYKMGNELQALEDINEAVDYEFSISKNTGRWFKRSFYCDDLDGNFSETGCLDWWGTFGGFDANGKFQVDTPDPEYLIDRYLDVITPLANDADALNSRGLACIEIEKYDAAINCFTAAIKISPTRVEAYILRGKVHHTLKNYVAALEDFDRAIELDATNARAYFERGEFYFKLRYYDKAIHDFDKIIALDPDDAEAYEMRGEVYFAAGDYERAIADCTQAVKISPYFIAAYFLRAKSYFTVKNFEQCISDCTCAIKISDFMDVCILRAEAYLAVGNYEQALSDFRRAIGWCRHSLANIVGEKISALEENLIPTIDEDILNILSEPEFTSEIIKGRKDLSEAHCKAGIAHYNGGRYAAAVTEFDKAVDYDPNCVAAYENLAIVYDDLGESKKAQFNFDKAAELSGRQ